MTSTSAVLDHPYDRSRVVDRVRGQITWQRAALAALLIGTALAYTWNLSDSGYANSFYAAAVQAGTKSWKALFFGSLDSSNFITVDKPPASLWVMALSGRIFGFGSWSMLLPQALEGVAAVWLLYAAVKRWFGSGAGLAAGAIFAATPVAALMFRFNNPDALLVLLMVAGAYCLVRALEGASTRWIIAAGTMIGFAFLAKMLQAFLVLPAFTLVYLYAAPTGLWRRVRQLLAGGLAVLVSAGWWVAIVALWPAGSRPFIDGSSDNSIFNLITGYNGLQRIFSGGGPGGGAGGAVGGAVGGAAGGGGPGGGANFSGSTGVLRLFNDLMGGQASWLLPASLLALGAVLWLRRHAPRTDRVRAAALLWGGWLLVTAIVFSFGQGVIHTYYTVALAPAIGALVAVGGAALRRARESLFARGAAAVAIGGTAVWAYALLDRTPSWEPWLRFLVLVCGSVTVVALLSGPALARGGRRLGAAVATLAAVAMIGGPVAYAARTISTAHTGSIPSAGPAVAGAGGGPGGGGVPGGGGAPGGGGFPGAGGGAGFPGASGGGFAGGAPRAGGLPGGAAAEGVGPRAGGMSGGGPGGATVSSALTKALKQDASRYRWVAATDGSQSAASIELATGGDPVMAIGGFNGNGGEETLSQFKQYVAKGGEIHYYVAGGGGAGGPGGGAAGGPGGAAGGASNSNSITSWVESNFKAVTIGGQTVYDLTQR
jgi:4-amino-4-deoxy-L-arabinose transferase-like glycosyltransferase